MKYPEVCLLSSLTEWQWGIPLPAIFADQPAIPLKY